ncbi:hypothetical protein Q3G72_029975 [Acer saccharum]|nr:hypothetical protein Q3G72_029975 [Acer saccharum]
MRGESKLRTKSFDSRRDCRSSFVSIFMDNLNPVVDQKGLWGIFKAFGLVRDIHLSPMLRFRKSRYAFIRFAYLDEAKRVAELMNGMHVYGWPILSKVANVDWDNRKKDRVNAQRLSNDWAEKSMGLKKVNSGQSFTNVVKESLGRNVHQNHFQEDKQKIMNWEENKCDSSWLEFNLVGVLKSFTDISFVIQVGETVLIEEETLDRTTLANGRVLVLIPYGQKCPNVVKWVSSVSAQEDEETLVKPSSKPSSNQSKPPNSYGDKAKNNDIREVDRLVEVFEALGYGKTITGSDEMLRINCGDVNTNDEELALNKDKGDEWTSSFEENALSENSNSHLVGDKTVNAIMSQNLGGNIIIDLGCGLD